MADSATFYALPEEILTAIADAVCNEDWLSILDLTALRLSCRRFAYLNRVLQHLFNNVRFVASPEHVNRLAGIQIGRLAPFIKAVTFVAPPPSWTISYKDFKKAVQNHVILAELECRQRQEQKTQFAFSDAQMREAYDTFERRALATESCFDGARLRETWISALQSLSKDLAIYLQAPERGECVGNYLPRSGNEALRHNGHKILYTDPDNLERCGPTGDDLSAVVVACLAKCRLKPRKLTIKCVQTSSLDWRKLQGWKELDLSCLKAFEYLPMCLDYIGPVDEDEADAGEDIAAYIGGGRRVNALLERCVHSLESFNYGASEPMAFPNDYMLGPPKLKNLFITDCAIRPAKLAVWISRLTLLERFEMARTIPFRDEENWISLFTAIQNHVKRMRVEFKRIFMSYNEMLEIRREADVCVHTGDHFGEEIRHRKCYGHNVDYLEGHALECMALYLCKRVEYTNCLKYWFGELDLPEPDNSDEEATDESDEEETDEFEEEEMDDFEDLYPSPATMIEEDPYSYESCHIR